MARFAETQREHGVPHRFSMGTLVLLLTLFAILMRLLTLAYAPVSVVACLGVFFSCAAIGQSLLFHGRHPRAASVVVGSVVAPGLLILFAIDHAFTNLLGIEPLVGLESPHRLLSTSVILSIVGMPLGYLAGGVIASVFLILDRVYPRAMRTGPVKTTESVTFQAVATAATFVGKWLIPWQPRTPVRGAIASVILLFFLATLVSPYFASRTLAENLRVALVIGSMLALLSGNFQLSVRWPVLFLLLGIILAVLPYRALLGVASVRMNIPESGHAWPHVALPWAMLTIGGIVGLVATALLGWYQWARSIRSEQAFSVKTPQLATAVVVVVGLGTSTTYQINAWANSPKQSLLTKVMDHGGTLTTWFPVETRLRVIRFAGELTDEDVTTLMPLFEQHAHPPQIAFEGKKFTDRAVASLNGFQLETLDLTATAITDQALNPLTDFSTACLILRDTDVGDKLVEQLGRHPTKPILEYLNLAGTTVTDNGMMHLRGCSTLETLDCSYCKIGDEGIINLGQLGSLRWITLSGTQIGDTAIKQLVRSAPRLVGVIVDDTEVTDQALVALQSLKSLLFVRCINTNVTAEGVAALRAANKNCGVQWDSGQPNQMPEVTDQFGRYQAYRVRFVTTANALQPYTHRASLVDHE